MKILLIHPATDCLKENPKRFRWEERPVIPIGLLYIASYLLKHKYDVGVVDCCVSTKQETIENIKQADVIGIYASTALAIEAISLVNHIRKNHNSKIIITGGPHSTIYPEYFLNKGVDFSVRGEAEETMLELIRELEGKKDYKNIQGISYRENNKVINNPIRPYIKNLDILPMPARHLIPIERYFKKWRKMVGYTCILLVTSRGCPFNCISGETKVNTVLGDIPIKNLVKKKKIGVYTYNPKTKKVFITDAINIREIGIKKIIRINFDDGTSIDCTPDHKFLVFKQGNQFNPTKEMIKEARDLKNKDSVRAIKFYKSYINCNIDIIWGRRKQEYQHRLVMEYLIKRKLKKGEIVHHKDKNGFNNLPDNLVLCKNQKQHYKYHPEISERMKRNNPVKHITKDIFKKIGLKNKGKKRTLKHGLRYRNSKLGKKNPNYKHGKEINKKSRIKEINHKVISIKSIGKGKVYDLEVPSTHWFFANNVLIHNCLFCSHETFGNYYRAISPKKVVDEMEFINKTYNPDKIDFIEDFFTQDKKRVIAICNEIKKRKLKFKWNCESRADVMDYEMFRAMKKAGCEFVALGVESGSQRILDYLNKGFTVEQIKKTTKLIKKAGLKVGFHTIFGTPTETIEDINLTRKLLREAKPDYMSRSFFTPLPGTPAWPKLKDKLLVKPGELLYTDFFGIKHDNFTREEMEELADKVYKEFLRNRFFNFLFFHPIKMLKAASHKIKTKCVKFKYRNVQ